MTIQKDFPQKLEVIALVSSCIWCYRCGSIFPPFPIPLLPGAFRVFSLVFMLGISPGHCLIRVCFCLVCPWFCSAVPGHFHAGPCAYAHSGTLSVLSLPAWVYPLLYGLCSSEGLLTWMLGTLGFYFPILLAIFILSVSLSVFAILRKFLGSAFLLTLFISFNASAHLLRILFQSSNFSFPRSLKHSFLWVQYHFISLWGF